MNQLTTDTSTLPDFSDLAIIPPVLLALKDVGYEAPSPIQALTIPPLLAGRDIVGQAQTGTGKTAAFALPLLSTLDLDRRAPQVLVLTPTRELAIQVAEAFQRYACRLPGFHVLPIYGGQDYRGQLRQLKQGVHVVVGTPGRVMDHMRRGTLKLDDLRALVLDEADEMLRMGFIEDVEWILEQSPAERQVALFSATLPREIRRIAAKHLKNPAEITVAVRTSTAECIRQRYWMVSGMHKLDALTRILEAEEFEAMIVFVRTKIATVELAEKLAARGYNATALNGDLQQKQREHIIERLRSGKLEILVATDVAARGLDVDRISHVINYDIPCDTEAYVHRIGRTGRFGKNGEAILFIAPREKHLLYAIEKATRQKIALMELPSTEKINNQRINRFTQQITDRLAKNNLEFFNRLIEQYQHEHNVPAIEIAAALASLLQGETPLLLDKVPNEGKQERPERSPRPEGRDSHRPDRGSARDKGGAGKPRVPDSRFSKPQQQRFNEPRQEKHKPEPSTAPVKAGLERYRLEVGKQHGVRPENIVGAIANEAGLDSRFIDRITIHDTFSTVDLPEGMPRDVYRDLKKVWVAGRQMNINRIGSDTEGPAPKKRRS